MTKTPFAAVRHILIAAVCGSALLLSACAGPGGGSPAPRAMHVAALAKIDDTITRDVAAGRLPGAVAVVYRDGRVVHQRVAGVLDAQTRVPMAADSIFRIYSMSKPIVSVALMMLVEDGKVLLGAPVARYLPEFRDLQLAVEKKDAAGNPVLERIPSPRQPTVQDLMRHTAGLTYGVFGRSLVKSEYLKAGVEKGEMGNTDFARVLATLPLAYVPGTTWEYSRATDLVGALIERVSGQPLGVYLQLRILGPLQMKDTGFSVSADKLHRVAQPFKIDPDSKQAVNLIDVSKPPVFESGGGGMVSTAPDYLRFCRMLLNGGELDGARIVSPKTVQLMLRDHLGPDVIRASRVAGATTGYLPGAGYGFGLGFAVRVAEGEASTPGSVGDASWGGFGGTSFWIDPRENLIGIWMMQAPSQLEYYRQVFKNMVYGAF